jgi:2,3,4,5-tetrahydropyridine-2-carboxylate N-succinyltransferase
VAHVLGELDAGTLRVAEKIDGDWTTHQWIKKAVLLSFRLEDNVLMDGGPMRYFDKVPTKFANYDTQQLPRRAASASCRPPWRAAAASSRRTWC